MHTFGRQKVIFPKHKQSSEVCRGRPAGQRVCQQWWWGGSHRGRTFWKVARWWDERKGNRGNLKTAKSIPAKVVTGTPEITRPEDFKFLEVQTLKLWSSTHHRVRVHAPEWFLPYFMLMFSSKPGCHNLFQKMSECPRERISLMTLTRIKQENSMCAS